MSQTDSSLLCTSSVYVNLRFLVSCPGVGAACLLKAPSSPPAGWGGPVTLDSSVILIYVNVIMMCVAALDGATFSAVQMG